MSTNRVEYHGLQKQFVGNDFLLGAAGHSSIIREVFNSLRDPSSGDCIVDSTAVVKHIVRFLNDNVTEGAAATTSFILILEHRGAQVFVQELHPSIYKSFVQKGNIGTLGSGAELIETAISRDKKLGIYTQPQELVDMMVAGENYLEAATQSLTVDAQFTVGILKSNNTYLIGDSTIDVLYAPPAVVAAWTDVARRYKQIMARVQQIRGEIRAAQRALSSIQSAELDAAAIRIIEANQSSIEVNRKELSQKIEDYCNWYDRLLER